MKAPHKVGQAFEVTLVQAARAAGLLRPDPGAAAEENYRDALEATASDLAELAESIHALGQLQRVGLYWTGSAYRVAFGFRRIAAMWHYRDAFGFQRVRCERVEETDQDLARLVENFQRLDPTSYETARYLYELHYGLRGRCRSVAEMSEASGKSASTISNLIRFYRVLAPELRDAWRLDRDERFSFRVLARLAVESQDSGVEPEELLKAVLGTAPKTPASPEDAPSSAEPGAETGADGSKGAAAEAEESGSLPPAASGEFEAVEDSRRFGRRFAGRLARRLSSAGDRLQTDDRAPLVLTLLEVVAGKRPVTDAERVVADLLRDLGVTERPRPARSVSAPPTA